MKSVIADYGSISLGKICFDFYVFERRVNICKGAINLQGLLGDGRFVVGAISSKKWWNKLIWFFSRTPRPLEVEIKEEFKFRAPVDEATKNQIFAQFLTHLCGVCDEPAKYQVSFTTFRDPLGGGGGYSISACLKHINEIIHKEDHDWIVYEGKSALLFGENYQNLGRVIYNYESQQFEQISPGPLVEQVYPESMSFSVGNKLIFDFNKKTGVLELGEPDLFDQLKQRLGQIPKKGISVELTLPIAEEPIILSGVKSLEFVQKGK